MLKLYISTRKKVKIATIFKTLSNNYDKNFQITVNYSYHKGKAEKGYKISFFELDKTTFRKQIWDPLSKLLNLSCAYVKYIDYMGCILNWPGVFTETKCISCLL